jgi:uncharacterized protein
MVSNLRLVIMLFSALSVGASFMSVAVAAHVGTDIVVGQRVNIQSRILNEERTLLIYLPASYETKAGAGRTYPVLYLLDGGTHFNALTGTIHHLSASSSAVNRMPETIVVGIANTKRTRDLTPTHRESGLYSENSGGAAAFLLFMKEELFPVVQTRYRASSERTLVGHSLGGLFTLHVFLHQPELFRHYIAIDPSLWWDDQLLVRRVADAEDPRLASQISVFVAHATLLDPNGSDRSFQAKHDSSIQEFCTVLRQREGSSLRARCTVFADETHLSVPLVAIYRGLLFANDKYDINRQ